MTTNKYLRELREDMERRKEFRQEIGVAILNWLCLFTVPIWGGIFLMVLFAKMMFFPDRSSEYECHQSWRLRTGKSSLFS